MATITNQEQKELLKEIIRDLKKEIIAANLNLRYIERAKLISKNNDELLNLEKNSKNWKLMIQELERKLDVAQDQLDGK